MTVVKTGRLFVRATVEEKYLQHVTAGARARVVAAPFPERKLAAKVEQVSATPVTPGTFEARVALEAGAEPPPLVAGMACTVRLTPYQKADALVLPESAVFAEELDEDSRYVHVLGKGGRPEKRPVKVGKTSGGKTEILSGLREGEEVLPEKPSAGKKPDSAGEKAP